MILVGCYCQARLPRTLSYHINTFSSQSYSEYFREIYGRIQIGIFARHFVNLECARPRLPHVDVPLHCYQSRSRKVCMKIPYSSIDIFTVFSRSLISDHMKVLIVSLHCEWCSFFSLRNSASLTHQIQLAREVSLKKTINSHHQKL